MSINQHESFDSDLVLLSFASAFLGSYLCIGLCEQLRMSLIEDKNVYGKQVSISHRKKHVLYLFLMAICFGGVGVWSMHYIGMHAFHLKDNADKSVKVMYNAPLMATSFLVVLLTTFVGLLVSCYDPMFCQTKVEIMEEFIEDSKKLSLKEIRKISSQKILIIIATKNLWSLILGGVITGSGIVIAHYIGMLALVFKGHLEWNSGFIAGSILLAMLAATLAFWVIFRLLSIFPEQELLRIGSGVGLSIAATGMHYVGMLAAHYKFDENLHESIHDNVLQQHLSERDSFEDILVSSMVLMWAMAMFIIWNSRAVAQRQAKIIRQADSILYKIADSAMNTTHTSSSGGSFHVSQTNSNSPNVIRNLVEQYVTKRCRAYAVQRKPRVVSGTEGSSILEKQQQQQMGFAEYGLHLLLLLVTCKWQKLWQAVTMEVDSSIGGSSRHSDTSADVEGGNYEEGAEQEGGNGDEVHPLYSQLAEMVWTSRKTSQNRDSTNSNNGGNSSRRRAGSASSQRIHANASSTSTSFISQSAVVIVEPNTAELPDTIKEEVNIGALNETPLLLKDEINETPLLLKDEIGLEIDIVEPRCNDAPGEVVPNVVVHDKEL